MHNTQIPMRLKLDRLKNEPEYIHQQRQRDFNKPRSVSHVPVEELHAQLLKRISRRVMENVTTCPPNQLPSHLSHLNDVCELIDFVVQHNLVNVEECVLSGLQLANPASLTDFRACLDHTKQYHRSPVFLNYHDEILNRIDLLASIVMRLNSCGVSSQNDTSSLAAPITTVNEGGEE